MFATSGTIPLPIVQTIDDNQCDINNLPLVDNCDERSLHDMNTDSSKHLSFMVQLATINNDVPIRHSTQEQHRPTWLNDFVSSATQSNSNIIVHKSIDPKSSSYTPNTLPYYASSSFTNTYMCFLANFTYVKEPQSYQEARHNEIGLKQ